MEIICYACGKGEYPENTLEAIQHCQNVNSNWTIEIDLKIKKFTIKQNANDVFTSSSQILFKELKII